MIAKTTTGGSILLVDDDDLLVGMLARSLRKAGYHVEVAGNAQGALNAAPTLTPDVLVTDAVLPDGNGLSIARQLRSENPRLGVVLISGHELGELGMGDAPENSEFLLKPFTREALATAVARVNGSS